MTKILRVLCLTAASVALIFTLSCYRVYGQGAIAPLGVPTYLDNNGLPVAGGAVCTYSSGTTTPQTTYSNQTLTQANSTCITLNTAGRPTSGGIFLTPGLLYRFVLQTSTNVTIWTIDGVGGLNPSGAGGYWSLSGSTLYNNSGSNLCLAQSPCNLGLGPLLDLQGSSSGNSYLIRIDDAAGTPGINLYAGGNSVGSYGGDASGLRLRDGSGNSQAVIATGAFTVQNAGAGSTAFTVSAGLGQSTTNLFNITDHAGSNLAWADQLGRFVAPLFNSLTGTGSGYAFQTYTNTFIVDGNGDITGSGTLNVLGLTDTTTNPNGWAITVAGPASPVMIVDNLGNATVTSLTCTGTPCGSGGGGGGTPGGAIKMVQYNNPAGTFAGTSDFEFDNALHLLTVATGSSVVAGVDVTGGFIQSDAGFVSVNCAQYNCFQPVNGSAVITGGMAAMSYDAGTGTTPGYIRLVQSSGSGVRPTLTSGEPSALGIMYFDGGGSVTVCTAATGTTCNTWTALAAGSTAAFGSITAGTNSSGAAMIVGNTSSLSFSGSGTVNANLFNSTGPGTGAAPVANSIWVSNGSLQPRAGLYADITATFSGCTGSSTQYLAANGTCQVASGGGSFLPLTGGTMSGNILASGSVVIGSFVSPFFQIFGSTINAATSLISNGSTDTAISVPSGGVTALSLTVGSSGIKSDLFPHSTATYNLGTSSFYWNSIYGDTILAQTRFLPRSGAGTADVGSSAIPFGTVYGQNANFIGGISYFGNVAGSSSAEINIATPTFGAIDAIDVFTNGSGPSVFKVDYVGNITTVGNIKFTSVTSSGLTGVTGSTCTQWTNGICTHL